MGYIKSLLTLLLITVAVLSCNNSSATIEICDYTLTVSKTDPAIPPEFDICKEIEINQYYQQVTDLRNPDINLVRVTNISENRDYEYEIYNLLTTKNANWYFHTQDVSTQQISDTANIFENEIYPSLLKRFGSPWISKVNSEDKLQIIHVPLGKGIGGYFKNTDMYPKAVYPTSNEITAIYLHSNLQIGSNQYLSILAHELQHAIHWNSDRTEETWFNEGMSEYSVNALGYNPFDINSFNPEVSLVNWSYHNHSPHYLSARLFFTFLSEQYLTDDSLFIGLVNNTQDGISSLNQYLDQIGTKKSFKEIFTEWSIYNLLNGSAENYSYNHLIGDTFDYAKQNSIEFNDIIERTIEQYSTQYVDIAIPKEEGNMSIRFDGASEISSWFSPIQTSTSSCYWSNRGDSIKSTLTSELNLSTSQAPYLEFKTAFNIEDGWDYLHILVSEDDGETWKALNTSGMKPAPHSMAHLSHGYTGSQSWTSTTINFDEYKSKTIILKLSYITDASTTGPGVCISDAVLRDVNQEKQIEWDNDGFLLLHDSVKQDFTVNVILMGNSHKVIALDLDQNNSGVLTLPIPEYGNWYVVTVSAMNNKSSQVAHYSVTAERSQHR